MFLPSVINGIDSPRIKLKGIRDSVFHE